MLRRLASVTHPIELWVTPLNIQDEVDTDGVPFTPRHGRLALRPDARLCALSQRAPISQQRRLPCLAELALVEVGIEPPLLQELLMCSVLHDATALQHQHLVGIADR